MMSNIAQQFLKVPFQRKDDVWDIYENPSTSTVGRYLLLLKALLSDYSDAFEQLLKTKSCESSLKLLARQFKYDKFNGTETDLYVNTVDWSDIYIKSHKFVNSYYEPKPRPKDHILTVKNVIEAFSAHLANIKKLFEQSSKMNGVDAFAFIIDEALMLCTDDLSKGGVSRFRLFRRAINRLERQSNLVVVTLGTDVDVRRLNPELAKSSDVIRRLKPESELTCDSDRESRFGEIFPPFIISRNWDVFLDYEELKRLPIGYNELLNGRMMLFWLSLGRPVWSSIILNTVVYFIERKVTNNRLESGEAYLAFLMIRVGLSVHPAHEVAQCLVKSLMGTLLYISPDFRNMRVYYPSEPALAIGARSILRSDEEIAKYYSALDKFIMLRAINTSSFSEIVSGDICLLAVTKAKRLKCGWDYEDRLPQVCKVNKFIFENSLSSGNGRKSQEQYL